ncbi:transcriptional regulator [Brevibacillus brevis]|uniref:helix-turn-helix domain-containing protein n=1 Tax=Brevibacillus brevis TaxID=1393 RepID=UPI0009EE700D|nr:helix-turn-helix transcriptional regulator [Brevibacillus brevis]OUQ90105.1 transcriptional regulator [Brevibacillus brevis]
MPCKRLPIFILIEVSRFGELSPTSGAEILSELIDKRGSRRAFAEEIGLPPTTLQSMLSRGVGRASIDNVIKVCRALGITVDELDNMASNRAIDVHTIAAHHDGDDWTEEELEEIERFKEFVKLKRKQQE